jgi:hypothetical protein
MVSGCIIIVGAVAFLVFFFIKCERIDWMNEHIKLMNE